MGRTPKEEGALGRCGIRALVSGPCTPPRGQEWFWPHHYLITDLVPKRHLPSLVFVSMCTHPHLCVYIVDKCAQSFPTPTLRTQRSVGGASSLPHQPQAHSPPVTPHAGGIQSPAMCSRHSTPG